ncbi:MAG: Calx-beta domain-containing protein [bacterium]
MHNGSSEVIFSSVICTGATVSNLNTFFVDITLDNGTSCALTIGGDSETIGYKDATLARDASGVYSLTAGTLVGGGVGGTFTSVKAEPTNHPSNFTATTNSTSQITTAWTDATGTVTPDSYLVLCNKTGTFGNPSDQNTQGNDTDCEDGGTGIQNIAQGTQTAVWTGLNAGTQYFFKIFPYSNTGSDVDYKIDGTPQTDDATTTSPTVNLSVSAGSGTEAGTTAITVTATADSAVSGAQTVDVGVTSQAGTITSSDYSLSNTTLTIADTQTTATVTFTVVDDDVFEGDETARLTISNPSSGITLGSTTTQDISITDNEAVTLNLQSATTSVGEAAGNAGIGVALTAPAGGLEKSITFTLTPSDGTAVDGSDYTTGAVNGSFATSATHGATTTLNIPIVNDATTESSESFTADLSTSTAGVGCPAK